jgi:hypothetical protein
MGNSNNKMTRSCVPSSTGSDKNNVKTMDERIDALVLRLHEVFLRSRSSRPSHAFCVRIFKHFERFFPVKSRLRVASSFEGARLEDRRCYSPRGLFKRRWSSQTGSAGKGKAAGWRVSSLCCSFFLQTTDQKKGSKLTKIFSSKNLSSYKKSRLKR